MIDIDLHIQRILTESTGLFVFILIISGNFIGELLPCRVQNFIQKNILFRHIIGYLTLLFFVLITMPHIFSERNGFLTAIYLYIFFLFLSKTYYIFWVAIVIILAIIYIAELLWRKHKEDAKKVKYMRNFIQEKEKEMKNNNKNDVETINEIKKMNKKINIHDKHVLSTLEYDSQASIMKGVRTVLITTILSLTTFGFLVYYGNKKREFKTKFNHITFFFGSPICHHKSPPVKSYWEEIKYGLFNF